MVSDTTLLGPVQHLTDGERYWFGHVVGGDPAYADVDSSMVVPPERSAAEVIDGYRASIAASDEVIAAAGGLDLPTTVPVDEEPQSLRWVLAHVTSETGRHAGHADILHELLDGTSGR